MTYVYCTTIFFCCCLCMFYVHVAFFIRIVSLVVRLIGGLNKQLQCQCIKPFRDRQWAYLVCDVEDKK